MIRLILQLLGLALHSSANAGEVQLRPQPRQFPERGVMMQRGRKAPAPSSSAASTGSDAPSQTGLSRWEITETSLTCLQTLQVKPATVHSSTWWHQDLYHVLIYLFFFLWGGGKGVRGFSIIRVSHPLSDLIAVGLFFGLGSLQQPVESNFPPPAPSLQGCWLQDQVES